MVRKGRSMMSICAQCRSLGIHRSGLYYRVMDLRPVLPGRHTSKRNKEHKTYPYPLRNLEITRANQVWATDITYIPMRKE
ncbi:hypothetical protein [Zobellia uliginosa]|uniref:hypothetical protein n=1 Tax=Zobellia uliginosa TaxID=143224 RepID=UPI0011155EA5|nr:hypothetical protein [Zobellia uliginosa]